MNRRQPTLAGALLLTMAVQTTQAANWFLAPTGSDAAAGTLAAPFASFAKAETSASPGDTVYLRGGTYSFKAATTTCASPTDNVNGVVLAKSGTASKPLHYYAYASESPVLDFSQMTNLCRIRGIWVSGSFVHLRGLEIKGVPQTVKVNHENWGVWISGGSNTFERLNIHHISGTGLFIQKGGSNLVLNCDSHHNYDSLTSNGAGQSGDGFGCHVRAQDTGNVFRGCRAWMNSDDGYDLINAFAPVRIEDSWAWQMGYLPGTLTPLPAGNGNGIKAGGYGIDTLLLPANPAKHTVRHCLSFSNKAAGFYTNHHPVSGWFYNNTAFGNHPNFGMLGINSHGAATTVGIFRNNVAYSGTALADNTHNAADDINNSWSTAGMTLSATSFASTVNTGMDAARKADGSLPDITFLHPTTTSPLVDAGVDVGFAYNGKQPDLGFWETGAPTRIATSAKLHPVQIQSRRGGIEILSAASPHLGVTVMDQRGRVVQKLTSNGNSRWIAVREPGVYLVGVEGAGVSSVVVP